jgi:hypothetical protein
MLKKVWTLLLLIAFTFAFVGCSTQQTTTSSKEDKQADEYHIAVVTPTLSTSEDEFRGAEAMVKKYPDMVKHVTLPENFETEIENCISTIVSQADDPKMKAIVVASGQSGLIPAFQQVKEKRPDIITITAPIFDDPKLMSKYIDINLDTNWVKRGETIPTKAQKIGAKTFIHYSFPTHLAKPLISKRKDMMEETCEKLGMEWVEVITPDPQTGNGPGAMQQFLREDIPRQIKKYGKDTNIFGSNCPMYDVILDEALKLGFIVAEQCCPTPTQAYPQVLGLEIAKEDATNFDKINDMIREKVKAKGMTGRLSGWPVPVSYFLPGFATEVAKKMVEDESFNAKDAKTLEAFAQEVMGQKVFFSPLEPGMDNYNVMIMDSIYY